MTHTHTISRGPWGCRRACQGRFICASRHRWPQLGHGRLGVEAGVSWGLRDRWSETQVASVLLGLPHGASQATLVVENLPASSGCTADSASTPGWGRSTGEGKGNPLQYSYLENSVDRGAWRARVHRVTKSCAQLITHTAQRDGWTPAPDPPPGSQEKEMSGNQDAFSSLDWGLVYKPSLLRHTP